MVLGIGFGLDLGHQNRLCLLSLLSSPVGNNLEAVSSSVTLAGLGLTMEADLGFRATLLKTGITGVSHHTFERLINMISSFKMG